MIEILIDDVFEDVVLTPELPVMVEFSATWCRPCYRVTPIIEKIGKDYADKVIVAKCDVEKCPATANKYSVINIPAVLYFNGGRIVDKIVGVAPEMAFVEKLKKLLLQSSKVSQHNGQLFSITEKEDGFCFNGQLFKVKGRLCHAIVKHYVEQNPNAALVTLQRAFNTATNMVVATPEMAKTIVNSDGIPGGDFYMKEDDMIPLKNGKVVVWKYWPERYFNPFMERVKALGYSIE